MKSNLIKWMIPFFLLCGLLSFLSLPVKAAPTAPDSVSVSITLNGSQVSQAAKGSKITIQASASGGSGGNGRRYEYSFSYKIPGSGSTSYNNLRNYSTTSKVDFTLSESGTYTFRIGARVTDNSGNSAYITKDINFKSVGLSNTSTISSSAVSLGEGVTVNASASGGSQYEYAYSVSKDDGSHYSPVYPSSGSAQYVASASCTYKPPDKGNYMLRVIVRDKATGATAQKVFSITASNVAILNQCDVSKTEVEITSKDQSISLMFKADKGKGPYKYRCSYIIEGSNGKAEYVVGSSSSFATVDANKRFILKKTGTYLFTFEAQDSSGSKASIKKRVAATANLINTSTVSSSRVSNKSDAGISLSATGGTGDYEYKLTYIHKDGKEEILRDYMKEYTEDAFPILNILKNTDDLGEDYTGQMKFKAYVRDRNLQIVKGKEFIITVIEAAATEISRHELNELVMKVRDWENSLKQEQRDHLNANQTSYIAAREAAYSAVTSVKVQNYEKFYFELYEIWMSIKDDALGDEFWMTKEVNNAVAFENSIIKSIEGWFTSFSGTNISASTFNFNMEDFVNHFSQIFVVFASSLLVILFGVNIIRTAIEYQLFTLKGGVTLFGRLILAELWIQLSTKICIMIVKIFNELMASIISSINVSGLLKITTTVKFSSSRSGVWLVGDIIDFFANLCPFLLIMLLIGVVLIVFLIVYVKLIIRTLEIAMLSVVSPVFFACSVGEATMPYFKKFITAFLSVCAEIIFMGLVYLAFLWYCKGVNLAGVNINDLYNFGSSTAGAFYTYIAVTVACGVMMIRPPQALRDLMR